MKRQWEFDALRGLMLVLMTVTHLPTRLASPLGQPFGFVSAAEGFVLLSGFMAGMVYTDRALRHGEADMRDALLKRTLKVYGCQAALLLFLFSFIATLGYSISQDAITNLVSFYLERPLTAFLGGFLLLYNPPLLDILPMYILFMVVSPVLLVVGLRHGWRGILAVSVGLWLGAQFGLGHLVYQGIHRLTHLPVPFTATGSFDFLAWQFLWVLGLWLGATQAEPDPPDVVFPRWMVGTAIALAATGLVWRHAVGQVPFPSADLGLNLMFDKWHLGPLRVLNLLALMLLTMHFAPWLSHRLPRWRVLETLGAASLPVFCAHLVLVLLALSFVGESQPGRPWWIDAALLAGTFLSLYAVARISQQIDQRTAALRTRLKARATQAISARDRK